MEIKHKDFIDIVPTMPCSKIFVDNELEDL